MKIGVPKEIKTNENRIALVPAGAEMLIGAGHSVLVETGGGLGSGFTDDDYLEVGAKIAPDAATVWKESEMIMKVKEPIKVEWPHMRKGQLIFTYFHFAADKELTQAHLDSGATCVAYETVELPTRELPLLTPMSEVAGMGAKVVILDISLERLRYLSDVMPANVQTIHSNRHNVLEQIETADLVVGGVLIHGAVAPKLIRKEDLKRMQPGSVIVDVAVYQGGCVETVHATTHENPTYVVDGVIHYAVANMPGGVPRT